ncbi:MAG: hypothetical protein IBJ10_02905 [Phycisphaerales bacterium]|nr:hypothetical protein [Phycisphaerales bacterium]
MARWTAGLAAWAAATGALAQPGLTRVDRLMYLGNPTCTGAKCHSGDPKMQGGQLIGDEFTIWTDSDPHAKAFKTLSNAASKAIASKLSIESAASSARCLSCHAADVPAGQRGERWALDQAVSCEACHGPAEKYLEPHAKAGWTAGQRKSLDVKGMREAHGLLDTSNLGLRATMCTACHLQIDKDLVDAGHPELQFEMGWYNEYLWNENYATHWTKPEGDPVSARLWAIGQMVSLDAARAQVESWRAKGWDASSAEGLVALYGKGAEVAKKHFGAGGVDALQTAAISAASAAAAAADLAGLAGSAANQQQREIVLFGVASLVFSCHDLNGTEPPDEFWDIYDGAMSAEGAAFGAQVQALAAMAK